MTIGDDRSIMLKRAWRKFDVFAIYFNIGDHLSDREINELIRSAEEGLRYLNARGERLAAAKAANDLKLLRTYLSDRKAVRLRDCE